MKNEEVIKKFVRGISGEYSSHNKNLKSVCGLGCVLLNYGVVIAFYGDNGEIYINKKYDHYSKTTQTIINKVKAITEQYYNYIPQVIEY